MSAQRHEDERDAKTFLNSLRLMQVCVLAFLSVSPDRFSSCLSSVARRGVTQNDV